MKFKALDRVREFLRFIPGSSMSGAEAKFNANGSWQLVIDFKDSVGVDKDVSSEQEEVGVSVELHNVASLKQALEHLPDDRMIIMQVVGNQSGAWNMHGRFLTKISKGSNAALITMDHPQLQHLPMDDNLFKREG